VEMAQDDEAAKATAALDGKEVGGRALKVNEARPKTEGRGPGGPRDLAEIGAEAAGADSRTRITAAPRGSRASPAGNAGSTQARRNTARRT
jgi:hypothetical protein